MTISKLAKKTGLTPEFILDIYTSFHDFSGLKINYSIEEFYKDVSVKFSNKCEELANVIEYYKRQNEMLDMTVKQQDETIKRLRGEL